MSGGAKARATSIDPRQMAAMARIAKRCKRTPAGAQKQSGSRTRAARLRRTGHSTHRPKAAKRVKRRQQAQIAR